MIFEIINKTDHMPAIANLYVEKTVVFRIYLPFKKKKLGCFKNDVKSDIPYA